MTQADAPKELIDIAIRLADEGIPIRAIARSMRIEPEFIRTVVKTAVSTGRLLDVPTEDWPADSNRQSRRPSAYRQLSDEEFSSILMTVFKLTPAESRMFMPLLRKDVVVSKEAIYEANENGRPSADAASPKMVDVLICKIRKKLEPFGIVIETVWGRGYKLPKDSRAAAKKLIDQVVEVEDAA